MRLVLQLLFVFGIFGPSSTCIGGLILRDTIVIDGLVVDVEAEVRFDSISTDLSKRDAVVQFATTVNGFLGRGGPPTGWRYWSRSPDVNMQVFAEVFGFSSRIHKRRRHKWRVHLDGGFMVTSLVSIDTSTFPDSLIGFLPATADDPLRMVTSQQFDIGTETDTLEAIWNRRAGITPFGAVGLDVVLGDWHCGFTAGARYRTRSSEDRPILYRPSLDGVAFDPGLQRNKGLEPMIQATIGYQKKGSPLTFQLTGLWIARAEQNQWWGIGVKYNT
ncbi:MAG: hypothetical protein CL845_08360 [Crocinitomicaceae bacterium]|nr:hypothetical protein [Crocinitomicaceae bacterium]|tara:strand:+ start:713 stop:1534 length:822 start_codon:yes stop_codon:yes gene_type:complete